jgi:hypothetical protein
MISINVVLILLFTHFYADFILQTDYQAKNKSSSNKVLLLHVSIYSLPFIAISLFLGLPLVYGPLNAALHFCTDYVTSRITKRLWLNKQVHWFFVVIGLDQFLHYAGLLLTYQYFK